MDVALRPTPSSPARQPLLCGFLPALFLILMGLLFAFGLLVGLGLLVLAVLGALAAGTLPRLGAATEVAAYRIAVEKHLVPGVGKHRLDRLEPELARLEDELKVALLPKDPADERDVIVEIRSGVGGDEASIWAGDLYRMYQKYTERLGYRMEAMDASESETGGYDKVTVSVKGAGAYSRLKYEGGVHRVQRVPKTESQGRVHTSTATVAG